MKIINRKIDEIIPYKNNPRNNDEAVDYVAKSIEEFGFKVPIILDKNNIIVTGHTRLKAAKKLGLKEVPTIMADDLTDEQIKAFRLADNKVSEYATWNDDLLNIELQDLDIDMTDFGFDIDLGLDEEQEIIEDEVPEVPEEPKAKLGDIYQLGNHRLMCGDSTNIDDMNKLLDGNKIDMVYTDAPYGISIVNDKTHKVGAGNLAKNKEYLEVKGDDTTDTAKDFYNNCVNIGIDNFILWGGNYFTDFLPFSPSWLIWDKRVDMNSNNFADGEMAWCSFKTPVRIYHQLWNGMIREGEHEDRVHPTQKPVRMQTEILKDFTNENDNILDGFGGSGSTLMACEQTNRNCFMIEYEPSYIDVIIQRWENFTGKKAIKL